MTFRRPTRPDRCAGAPADSYLDWIGDLDAAEHDQLVRALSDDEAMASDLHWSSWAHEGQLPPAACSNGSLWRTWVIMAGRGFGKTLAGAKWITAQIAAQAQGTVTGNCPHSSPHSPPEPLHIALVGATLDEARRVMVEGRSGLLEVADAWVTDWHPSLRRLKFRTGAIATLFSGASPEQLRGPEHHLAWCDELAKWERCGETWDMLQFGLRLGTWPRALITTTPRPGPVLREILAQPDTVQTGGPTAANPHNPKAWIDSTHRLYAGTRLGRQELDGELLTDAAGALWTVELIERCRLLPPHSANGEGDPVQRGGGVEGADLIGSSETPEVGACYPSTAKIGGPPPHRPMGRKAFTRIVIAVDPPAGDGTCGIVACAKDGAGIAHILADHSVTARSPEGWARAVADAVRIWRGEESQEKSVRPEPVEGLSFFTEEGKGKASTSSARTAEGSKAPAMITHAPLTPYVVAEQNQGGKMVKSVLHTADPNLRVKLVTATVGKAERAAPVAMLFEAGKVVLHGKFPELEAELLGMIAGGDYEGPGNSPDRADAMVWGLTELMLAPEQARPSVRAL